MEQVSGRAGRKTERGKVMIQSMNVSHPVLQYVQQHDYIGFYNHELQSRKEFFYPPFSRLIMIILKHKDKNTADNAAEKLAILLKQDLANYIVGPAAPVVGRLRNQYIYEIMIKLPKEQGMSGAYKRVIRNHINLLLAEKQFRSVHIITDVDAM